MDHSLVLGSRRDATRVMYDILSLAKDGISKTQMVYKANLNFHLANGYIQYLLEMTFIRKSERKARFAAYELTERGLRLLRTLEELYSPSLLSYPTRLS